MKVSRKHFDLYKPLLDEPRILDLCQELKSDRIYWDDHLIQSGYVRLPSGDWVASGMATPGQMVYFIDWLKNRKV